VASIDRREMLKLSSAASSAALAATAPRGSSSANCPGRPRQSTQLPFRCFDRTPARTGNRQQAQHCRQRNEFPPGTNRRYGRRCWCRRGCRHGTVPILLSGGKISAAHPRVQLRLGSVDRAYLVMQVPVDRHSLALLPALDRGHIALEVGRDLLPRIQPVFRQRLGRRFTGDEGNWGDRIPPSVIGGPSAPSEREIKGQSALLFKIL